MIHLVYIGQIIMSATNETFGYIDQRCWNVQLIISATNETFGVHRSNMQECATYCQCNK